ncbi:hypothetical protein [Streptomyces sirii]
MTISTQAGRSTTETGDPMRTRPCLSDVLALTVLIVCVAVIVISLLDWT